MNRKIIIIIFVLVVLSAIISYIIISGIFFNVVQKRETLYVDPQTSVGTVGQSFTVNISVSNVTNLYGWEFKLGWNATILNVTNVMEGPFLKSGGNTFFTFQTNNTVGFVLLDCSLLGDVSGVNGSEALVTIQFHVKESGDCDLDLYDTSLINSFEQSITHTVIDGHFNSIP